MAEATSISWTDATFNPWIGCTKVSPGCDNCYAKADFEDRKHRVTWGAGHPRSRTAPANWKKPLLWNTKPFYECRACGWRGDDMREHPKGHSEVAIFRARRRVFCASLADVFDNEVPEDWRHDLFDLWSSTPNIDWLVLTKRIGNALRMLPWIADEEFPGCDPLPNVWLGATVVNQEEADRDIPKLLATPARVRFLSMEPLLGPVDLTQIEVPRRVGVEVFSALEFDGDASDQPELGTATLDWVIVGGESGAGARPMHPEWVRGLRDECAAAGVPFHFKQWGEWLPVGAEPNEAQRLILQYARPTARCNSWPDGETLVWAGKPAAGRLLDGVEHNAFPEVG